MVHERKCECVCLCSQKNGSKQQIEKEEEEKKVALGKLVLSVGGVLVLHHVG